LNETFLDSSISDHEINIDNFILFRRDRNRHGGGVALYIHKDLKPTSVNLTVYTECVWAIIKCNHTKFIVGSLYRPPDSKVDYYESICNDLDNIFAMSHDIIVMGDLNYDCFKPSDFEKLRNFENSDHLSQLITEPTRKTTTSSTIIDHIYTSKSVQVINSGVLNVTLSDHYPVFAVISGTKPQSKPIIIRKRCYNKFNIDNFCLISCLLIY
jgi:exonuclease III